MGLNPKQYVKKPNRLEVVELTKDNIEEVSAWCGGSVEKVRNALSKSYETTGTLAVPSIYGSMTAEIGSFIARETETGRFSIMTEEHLEQEYQQVGLRQDGIFGKRG